jgi:hypothetical protein
MDTLLILAAIVAVVYYMNSSGTTTTATSASSLPSDAIPYTFSGPGYIGPGYIFFSPSLNSYYLSTTAPTAAQLAAGVAAQPVTSGTGGGMVSSGAATVPQNPVSTAAIALPSDAAPWVPSGSTQPYELPAGQTVTMLNGQVLTGPGVVFYSPSTTQYYISSSATQLSAAGLSGLGGPFAYRGRGGWAA